ncbi:MAG: ATP-binding protein [Actinomycetota bacterium]
MADKASLSDLRRTLRQDLAAAGVADPVTFDCLVAVTEMWTRSAGRAADPAPSVHWDITSSEACFSIEGCTTKSSCMACHPSRPRSALEMPSETLEDLSMALVTGLMDRVEVSETTSGRTIRLTKLL